MSKTSELIWQDQQHQRLFVLIDDIKCNHADAEVFSRLYEYAEHHFSLEEAYMQQLGYPECDQHTAAHNKFREELKRMQQEHHTYDAELRRLLSEFLTEWLTRHIMRIDKKLEEFIWSSAAK
ncbi:hemerythrin domain-containing protein [Neptuniibacter sp. CAU 1671]|uniref:hemerythrin domain-containing protein n=1 Tax=Neptuniibacter sp. CAU 1671 TaxID=3032593 RepID=UPI0023D98A0D|nr:hemerythrin domain-containing protein [Neptuniibacter sp. CAU 1671]MDF2180851.1 hemerythrin domain-containing protein [Neptuniibacter sp. CAU 1671]